MEPEIELPRGVETQLDLDISCADPKVAGPSWWIVDGEDSPRIWRDIAVEVEGDQQFIGVEGTESSSVVVEIKRCETTCGEIDIWTLMPRAQKYNLGAGTGRYLLRVSRSAHDPGPVRLRWLPV